MGVEQLGYSRKLTNRLRSIFDASQLVSVGGTFDGSKIKSRQLMDHIPPSPIREAGILEAAEFNVALPRTATDLLFANRQLERDGYIMGLGGIDYPNLPKLAVDMTQRKKTDDVVIRIVHGATTEMPLRALSSLLPALVLMEQLQKDCIQPPQLQMISAHHISGELNRLDLSAANVQAERFANLGYAYTKTFFPSLAGFVIFLQDVSPSEAAGLGEELIRIAVIANEQISPDTINALNGKGNSHDISTTNKILYAGAHLLIHDTTFPGNLRPIIPDIPLSNDPTTIISIGGKQEEFFYRFRHQIKNFLGETYQKATLQYFTKHHVPPYYMAQGGDVSLDQVLRKGLQSLSGVATTARYDLEYLERMSYRRGDFEDFIEIQRRTFI